MTMTHKPDVEAAGALAGEYDVGAAFGEHAIEWWMYDGARLVPAPPEQAAMLSHLHDAPRRLAHVGASGWRGVWRRRPAETRVFPALVLRHGRHIVRS